MLILKRLVPTWKFSGFLLGIFLLTGFSFGQLGKIAPVVPCLEQTEQTYALYRPSYYTRKQRWPMVILLDDSGNGQTAVAAFREGAEAFGFILASPNGFRLHPDMDIRSNPVIWIYQDLIRRFAVDIDGIYFAGLGKAGDLMLDLTKRLQTNAGLILAAPNPKQFPTLKSLSTRVAFAQGQFDPNTHDVRQFLKQQSRPDAYRFVAFEGGRQWPHGPEAREILGWLLAQSYKSRKLTPPKQADWFKTRATYAESLKAQNQLVQAKEHWQAIQRDFSKSTLQSKAKDALQKLEQSQAFQDQEKSEKAAFKMEAETMALFKTHMKPELFDQPQQLKKNLDWWQKQHETLTYLYQTTEDQARKNTAIRLIEYLWQVSYLEGLELLEEERFAKASYHFQLATHLFSDKPFAYYALACAYAGLDQSAKALANLKQSVAKGLDDPSLIQLQPLFDRYRDEPEFKALSEKFRK